MENDSRMVRRLVHNPTWTRRDNVALVVSVLLAGYFWAHEYMPRIEGNAFPVVTPARLGGFEVTPPPPYRSTWQASAEKLRDCEYIQGSLSWYLGPQDGRRVQVPATFTDPPQVRGVGLLHWEGLRIDLAPDLVRTNSHALVRHQCPWRFWETETVFYSSFEVE